MKIEQVFLKGFRNYNNAVINFNDNTLIIGENDIGKTNLIYALRLLLDRRLSDLDIEPSELDFYANGDKKALDLEILIKFSDIKEEAALSILKENVSDDNECFLKYVATKDKLDYQLFIGPSNDDLSEIQSRYYLKYINFSVHDKNR